MQWSVVVPVKRLTGAKSRLRGALPGVPHELLVLAVVRDTVAAAVACAAVAEVIVVTDEPAVAAAATELGARSVPDRPATGLNPAFERGAAAAPGGPVAALTGDLPALRPDELAEALAAAGTRRGFVPDAVGTGTTLLVAPSAAVLAPRFGLGSAAAHTDSGAATLVGPWPGLRRDVDTPADLIAAAALGLGRHTAGLLARGRTPGPAGTPDRITTGYRAGMQGTVASYDPDVRSGTVLLDDGTELTFPSAAFDASGLRLLRPGQRVRLAERAGVIVELALITMP